MYTLLRSKRKTLAIYIKTDGQVEVRAPLRLSVKEINRFIAKKEEWIAKHVAIQVSKIVKKAELNYHETIPFLGENYTVCGRDNSTVEIDFEQNIMYIPNNLETPSLSVISGYKKYAKIHLTERVDFFAKQMGIDDVKCVKITSAKTRWGSCSYKKSINFSWQLMTTDRNCVDYVVVHELAHIIELNHSDRFWDIVKSVLPDYEVRKLALKTADRGLLELK